MGNPLHCLKDINRDDGCCRILSGDYVPSQDDLIRVRVRTTGIVEVNFTVKEKRAALHFQVQYSPVLPSIGISPELP